MIGRSWPSFGPAGLTDRDRARAVVRRRRDAAVWHDLPARPHRDMGRRQHGWPRTLTDKLNLAIVKWLASRLTSRSIGRASRVPPPQSF
jgi:hypothetical protein